MQTHHTEAVDKAGYRHAQPHRHLEGSAALVVVITVGACSGSPQVRSITLTFIRHAESQSNAAQIINTDIPGPSLSEEGQAKPNSWPTNSPATTSTASTSPTWSVPSRPLSHWPTRSASRSKSCPVCGKSTRAGTTTPRPRRADLTYLLAPADWLNGDLKDAIPGSISGNEFNDQFTAAVQKIYDSRNTKPVAFSHAEAIMYWTLMNVKNPKDSLATSHPLPNLGRVVVTGSPATGWTLVDWDGIRDFSY